MVYFFVKNPLNADKNLFKIFFFFFFQGRLCIYELMAEESAVNYWEVLTKRNLRYNETPRN